MTRLATNSPPLGGTPVRTAMIEADGLSKFYGDFAACRDVTFSIRQGEVAAFLGPNGAGKSTTMKLLTGYLAPSEGEARIAGYNVATERIEAAKRLGYLPENGPLYPDMTPRSLLRFFGSARGMTRQQIDERMDVVIDLCKLSSVVGKPIGKALEGLSAARRHGPGPAARAGRADHGRADRRPRPQSNPRSPRNHPPHRPN